MNAELCIQLVGINNGLSSEEAQETTFGSFLYDLGILDFQKPGSLVTHLIVVDHPFDFSRDHNVDRIPFDFRSLVQFEPRVVLPINYSQRNTKMFKKIIRMGGDPGKFKHWLEWPQIWPSSLDHFDQGINPRLDKIVSVNSNKISFIEGERYTLRRQAFERIDNLDLYGSSWDLSISQRVTVAAKALVFALSSGNIPSFGSLEGWFRNYLNWQGQIGSGYSARNSSEKLEVMSRYKYALVIENSIDYMSEKLFDAFFSGCIPVYVGPNVQSFGIPSDLVIQVEPNVKSISKGLELAQSKDFKAFHRRLQSFLLDQKTVARWSHGRVYEKLLEKLTSTP